MFPFQKHPLVLGSRSPRRSQLLQQMGLQFRCLSADIDESYPLHLKAGAIASYLAEAKAEALFSQIRAGEILITSDTVVWQQGRSLEKPYNREEAEEMLQTLSGSQHQVITGVCLRSHDRAYSFTDAVEVEMKELPEAWIKHYLDQYAPYDKAGAYGIQEWIGMVGIQKIHGSFFTVMGLPTAPLFAALQDWEQL